MFDDSSRATPPEASLIEQVDAAVDRRSADTPRLAMAGVEPAGPRNRLVRTRIPSGRQTLLRITRQVFTLQRTES